MGSLSNLYISQSYQSLIHLGTNEAANSTPTELQDGLGNGIGVSVSTNKNLYVSGNVYATNLTGSTINTGSLVTTSSFNAYTSSNDSKVNSLIAATASYATIAGNQTFTGANAFSQLLNVTNGLGINGQSQFGDGQVLDTISVENIGGSLVFNKIAIATKVNLQNLSLLVSGAITASGNISSSGNIFAANLVTSAITASSLITASVSQSTITFTKGDGSQFNIVVADVSGSSGNFVTTASFNSYTASQDFKNTTFATTSSVNTLSSSIYQIDATQSFQITANSLTASNSLSSYSSSQSTLNNTLSSSITSVSSSLNTFSSSYKVDSSSFDNRINSLTAVSGGYVTTASFNSYTQSVSQSFETQSFLNGTFATTASVNTLSSSIFQTDSTQSNLINGKLDTSSFTTFSTSVDSRLDSIEFLDTTFATTASVNTLSASIYQTDSTQSNNISALSSSNAFAHSTFATTGSNTFVGNQIVNGAISASGNISASSLYVTDATIINLTTIYETSSVIYSSGSNQFGDSLSDVQILSGSVQIVGGLTLNGSNISTQSFVDLGPLNQFTASQIVSNSYFATTSSVDNLSASVYQTDSTQSNQISANSQSAATSFSASNANVVALSSSIYTTDSNQQNQINSLINATSSYAISSSVKVVTDGLQNEINTLSTTASVNSLSASIYQTDSTQSNNIANNSSSIGLLQTFSGSQYKADSASFDSRIDNLEFVSGGFVTTASFNSYTQSNDSKVNNLNTISASYLAFTQSYYSDSSSFSNRIEAIDDDNVTTASFNSYTQSTDNRLNSIEAFTASVSTSVGLLQTFSSSQYKADSASFDSRIIAAENTGYVTTASFNQYTASQDFLNTTFATTSSVNSLSASIFSTDATQSSLINGKLDTSSFTTFSTSVDSRLDLLELSGSGFATTASVNALSASIFQTDSTQSNAITNNSSSFATSISASNFNITNNSASVEVTINNLSSSIFQTDATQSNNITINSASAWGAFQSASAYSASLAASITGSSANVTALSSSIYQTDATQSNNIATLTTKTGSYATTGSNQFIGNQAIDGTLTITGRIIGSQSLNLQPNANDARILEIYNTSPTDTHITASGGQLFLGDDITYVKVDNYGSVDRIDIVAGNLINLSSSVQLTGSIDISGNLIVNTITASAAQITYLHTIYESSSVIYSSGSNQLGDELSDTQILSGSVKVVGGLTLNGVSVSTQSVDISALNSFTASQFVSNSYFATTGSNTFVGNQIVSGTFDLFSVSSSLKIEGNGFGQTYFTTNGAIVLNPGYGGVEMVGSYRELRLNDIYAAGFVSASTITGLGNATLYSQSVDSRILAATGSSINTGSFATTGSNTFNGNQTLSGSKIVFNQTGNNNNGLSWNIGGNIYSDNNKLNFNAVESGLDFSVSGSSSNNIQFRNLSPSSNIQFTADDGQIRLIASSNSIEISGSTGTTIQNVNFIPFSSSLNSRINSLEIASGGFVTTASFNSYTSSQDFKNSTFATTGSNNFVGNQTITGEITASGNIFSSGSISASYLKIVDLIRANSINTNFFSSSNYVSASNIFVANNITTIGDISSSTISGLGNASLFSSSVNSRINSITFDTSSLVTTSSFNSYTSSQDFKNTTFATTASNAFTGQQTLTDVDRLNQITLDDHSGSLVLYGKGFTSSSLSHVTATSAGVGNIIFKTNNNTSTTIVSGSNNLFVNAGTPATGFTRYIGGSGNIMLGQANVPQISSSMTISPTMNNNYFGGNNTTLTMRGPISSSAWTISANNVIGAINIGSSAGGNAQGIQSGLTMTANTIAGTLNIVAASNTLSSSVSFTNNILNGTAGINANSSSVSLTFNNINDNGFTLNNSYFSGSAGVGTVSLNRNNIGGQTQTITIQGSQPAGTTNATSYSDNAIFGGSNILFADVSSARVVSTNAYHSAIRNVIGGNQLIISASSALADTTSFGSAYFGRWNADDGIRNKTSDIVFAVGTGTSTSNRKTGFLITSGSNTFIEGSLNVSGSTSLTGSLTIQSGSSFFANGNKQFNVGAFSSLVTQSGSAGVSQSVNFEVTDISDGISIASNSRITLANRGTYSITFSAQIKADGGQDTLWMWLKKNGTNVANTSTKIVGKNGEETVLTVNYVVDAVASDYYELVWENLNGYADLLYETASGNYPAIPSIILTVTQVN